MILVLRVKEYIKQLYNRSNKVYRHLFLEPQKKAWMEEHFCSEMKCRFLELGCSCECQINKHEHWILECDELNDKRFFLDKRNWARRKRRAGLEMPSDMRIKGLGNKSMIMNRVCYILGTTSKNYRNGESIYKKDCHYNHTHPFNVLPNEKVLSEVRKQLREEDDELYWDLEIWKDEMARKKANKQNSLRPNRVTQ